MTETPSSPQLHDKAGALTDEPMRAAQKRAPPRNQKSNNQTRIVILGALSEVAEATARLFAAEGASLLLAGDDGYRLNAVREDLMARGADRVKTAVVDFEREAPNAVAQLEEFGSLLGGIDHILLMYAHSGDTTTGGRDPAELQRDLNLNFTCAALWCEAAARRFWSLGSGGSLLVATSISGDRGRRNDYAYGAVHGGLTIFVQGLAHDLERVGARAVAVKLGVVERGMPNGGGGTPGVRQTPEQAGAAIHRAVREGGPVVYGSRLLRVRALVIRSIPAFLLHRS